MAFTTYAIQKILNAYGQNASLGAPATHYVGLLTATTWQASHSYSSGTYVIPSTFGSISGEQGKVFKCTTAGTSGASEPTWVTTEGGTNTDNTVTWTEVSSLFQAGTFTGAEMSAGNYARVAVTANSTNFPNSSGTEPNTVIQNGTAINFLSPSVDWGLAVGFIISDASTAGNIWQWGAMTSELDCVAGSNPSFGANSLSLYLSALLTA